MSLTETLPVELWTTIAEHLPIADLSRFSRTSNEALSIVKDDTIWEKLCDAMFPNLPPADNRMWRSWFRSLYCWECLTVPGRVWCNKSRIISVNITYKPIEGHAFRLPRLTFGQKGSVDCVSRLTYQGRSLIIYRSVNKHRVNWSAAYVLERLTEAHIPSAWPEQMQESARQGTLLGFQSMFAREGDSVRWDSGISTCDPLMIMQDLYQPPLGVRSVIETMFVTDPPTPTNILLKGTKRVI